jgi:DNA-binding transcriptional LysR family regulator
MDTELLKTFLEVRKTRHFGRAAENLFITQAAVSARIKQLEEVLGVNLFIRNRNNIQLSSEGERLVPHAEAVLLSLVRARQDVALEDAGSSQVFLGVRTGIWGETLQKKLVGLLRARPEISMRIESHEPGDITRRLLDRTLDLAILYEPPSLPELKSQTIGELTLRLYSTGARDSVARAMAANYVYLDWGGGFAHFHNRSFGEHLVPALHTNMNELASDYLAQQGGACYLPNSLRARLRSIGLTPVRGAPEFRQALNVAYPAGSANREVIEGVVKLFSKVRL